MAKQKDRSNLTLDEASDELRVLLVKLYKSKIFIRAGKELSSMLFSSGVEAGSLIAGITALTERNGKIAAANQAILKLSQTQYILKTMELADLYRAADVAELSEFIGDVIDGLREMLADVPAPQRTINVSASVASVRQPAPVYNTIVNVTKPEELSNNIARLASSPSDGNREIRDRIPAGESAQTDANLAEVPFQTQSDNAAYPREESGDLSDGFDDFVEPNGNYYDAYSSEEDK